MNKFIRYIGSKESLFDFIFENFNKYNADFKSFGDMFAGTNVVSKLLINNSNVETIYSCDMSIYSEVLSVMSNVNIDNDVIKYLQYLNDLKSIEGDIFNEFSYNGVPKTIEKSKFSNQKHNSRLFFTENVGKKIDAIKTQIKTDYENDIIDDTLKNISMSLLLNFVDSNAHTTGIYGAYLKNESKNEIPFLTKNLINELKKIKYFEDKKVIFNRGDILESIKNIPVLDILYFDPPYNTRKYESNYHILNYISNLDFSIDQIKYNTITGLPSEKIDNPFGVAKKTKHIFENMIKEGIKKCNTMFISYNNEGVMKQSDIEEICNKYKLQLTTETKDYKKYKSNNNGDENKIYEILWIIKK